MTTPIYLDHMASTPVAPSVAEAMAPYWSREFGNPHSSLHAFGWRASDAVEEARRSVADLIGADPDEIVFTSGATEANNLALLGLLQDSSSAGRSVAVSAVEHKCVLACARRLERQGYGLREISVLADGRADLASADRAIDAATALASLMLVNNETGALQPVADVADICRSRGAILHCDAAQAASFLEIDVDVLGVHMLSLSGHKIYGPKGIGALYVSREIRNRLRPLIHGGGQEGGLRSGTLAVPLCVGFGAAARLAAESRRIHLAALAAARAAFLAALAETGAAFSLNGAPVGHPGCLNLRLHGVEADHLISMLQPDLAVSSGSACSSGIPEPSHVLRAMGLAGEAAAECVRIGLGRGTTPEDAAAAARLIGGEAARILAQK